MTESQETPAIKAENNGQYKTKNDKEGDGDVDAEPAHHARRPMNAFLIFCKRHRSVVRDKYPNLENRSITKILGEWWANLEKEEKASYTGLAKQYKDAFFDANPGFKWYKLPAPPLRTFAVRPANSETASLSGEPFPPDDICRPTKTEQTNNNHLTKLNYNVQPSTSKQLQGECKQMFTPGKLADEAQMGGISSLFLSDSPPRRCETDYEILSRRLMPHSDAINPPGTPKSQLTTNATLMPNPPKKRPFCDNEDVVGGTNFYRNNDISPPGENMSHLREAKMQKLQDALSETTRSFAMSFETSNDRSNALLKQLGLTKNSNRNNENINDFSNYIDRDKSKGNNTVYNSAATRSPTDNLDELTQQRIIDRVVNDNLSREKYQSNVSSDESQDRESHLEDVHGFDSALSRSTGRACKGKRYKQFMAYGGLIVNKRQKKEHTDGKTSLRNDMRNRLPYSMPATCTWKAYDAVIGHRPPEPEDAIDKLAESNLPYYEQREVPVSAYKYPSGADDTGQHAYYYDEHSEQGGEQADNLGNKMFKASDFDLDAKIGALPSLSLEKFLLKKKENKKRKKNLTSSKHSDRPRYPSTVMTTYSLDKSKGPFFTTLEKYDSSQKSFQPKPVADCMSHSKSQTTHQTITEDDRIRMAEQRKSAIIGSKKRKPRKHSITRLDVNSSTNLHHCSDKADIAKTTCTNVDKLHMKPTSNSIIQDQNSQNTEDLCALATLAEVAANTCKINEDA